MGWVRILYLVAACSIYAVNGQANTTRFSQYQYTFVPRAATWAVASSTCAKTYKAQLASVHSLEEHNYIMDAFVNSQDVSKFPIQVPSIYPGNDNVGHRGIWLGLRTDVQIGGAWEDNTTVDFTNWIEGKPDNFKAQEGCVELYVDTTPEGWAGLWDDISCLAAMPYLCRKYVGFQDAYTPINYRGFDYIWHPKATAFDDAQSICRDTDNGYLVSVATQAELNFLLTAFVDGQPTSDFQAVLPAKTYPADYSLKGIWIGYEKSGGANFTWLDSNTTKFTAWADTAPDNFSEANETCAHIYLDELPDSWYGRWNDVSCKAKMGFVCKRRGSGGNATSWDNSTSAVPTVNLDGINAEVLSAIAAPPPPKKKADNTKSYIILGVVCGSVVLLVLLCVTCRIAGRRQRRQAEKEPAQPVPPAEPAV